MSIAYTLPIAGYLYYALLLFFISRSVILSSFLRVLGSIVIL